MDIKEFLLKGGTLKFPYKKALLSWHGEISISIVYDGYDKEEKVISQIPRYESVSIKKLDEAIDKFISVAMSNNNIYHIQGKLQAEYGLHVDLDEESLIEKMKELGYKDSQIWP